MFPKKFLYPGLLGLLLAGSARAGIPLKIYGQELVDRTLLHQPDLRIIALYATPKDAAGPVLIASNIGRIGSAATTTELEAIAGKAAGPLAEGSRLRLELPLHDVTGQTVGAIRLEWNAPGAGDNGRFLKDAERIRDGLSRRILNAANLFDPYPFDALATTSTYAQKLVDTFQAAHPELEVLALRGHDAAGELVLLGSTFGRQGKKADGDDLKVLNSTAPNTGVYSNGRRFGIDLALHDRARRVVGTMNVGYAYQDGADTAALVERSLKLRGEIERKVEGDRSLAELDP